MVVVVVVLVVVRVMGCGNVVRFDGGGEGDGRSSGRK